jgi:hypothetical protein
MTAIHFGALVPQGWKREFAGLDSLRRTRR